MLWFKLNANKFDFTLSEEYRKNWLKLKAIEVLNWVLKQYRHLNVWVLYRDLS